MSLGRVFLGGLLSSRARLRSPAESRSATNNRRSPTKIQRAATVEFTLVSKKGAVGTDRVVNQLRAALRRRQEESTTAFRAAEAHLRSELRGDLTALLLSSGMALHDPLPAETEAKLKSIQEVASRMKARLHAG